MKLPKATAQGHHPMVGNCMVGLVPDQNRHVGNGRRQVHVAQDDVSDHAKWAVAAHASSTRMRAILLKAQSKHFSPALF